ncbi:MAG TPA: leucyl/phenylalanyl-tRNA--protein transferase [Spirochaetales bacterium]|nr:leucyl/phenylalanyl-tRNA--protein transferase [Spirochaetales bacterium]
MEDYVVFPSPDKATQEGLLCIGGDLSPPTLLSAYRQGIFPWYSDDEPILWFSPDPRFIMLPETFHIGESARKLVKKRLFRITVDVDFPYVIQNCAHIERKGQRGTWIVPDMIEAYCRLHELGYAHSVEAWQDGKLVGGLYGVSLGRAFFGESMFSKVSGASRCAFLNFATALFKAGFNFIDSQVYTDYVAGMGGISVSRRRYLSLLRAAMEYPDQRGSWKSVYGDDLSMMTTAFVGHSPL